MSETKLFDFTNILVFFTTVLFCVILRYHWNRRRLYYYASKLPGPFSLPLLGIAYRFIGQHKGFWKTLMGIIDSQPQVFKMWLGQDLVVMTTRPRDLEIILSKNTNRGKLIKFAEPLVGEGLMIAENTRWKMSRKIINPTFSLSIIHSFIEDFNRNSNRLVEKLRNYNHSDSFDILKDIFCCNIDTGCEALFGVDSSLISGQENYMKNIIKIEKLAFHRVTTLWSYNEFIWKRIAAGKETEIASKEIFNFVKKIIDLSKIKKPSNDVFDKKKNFVNYILEIQGLNLNNKFILEESQNVLLGASETVAYTISILLVLMGIYPDIQEKLYKEIVKHVGEDGKEITLDNLNKMNYLDAVVKETLRLYPTVPLTPRELAEDVDLGDCTIPAGANFIVSMSSIHKLPNYWNNPKQFNPDRFFYKEDANLPRSAYMPFGYGPRNCIGFKYALLLVKVMVATLLKHYKFYSVDYKSINEFDFYFHAILELKKGYKVKLQERNVV